MVFKTSDEAIGFLSQFLRAHLPFRDTDSGMLVWDERQIITELFGEEIPEAQRYEDFAMDEDVIIAHQVFEEPLPSEHGGPVRLVIPKRYAWKSAKWLKAIEIHKGDKPGFWEVRGYNNNADPWAEERYSE